MQNPLERQCLPSIAKHMLKHSIIPLKNYGQNFLFDYNLCEKIVRASGITTESSIIEIGPGGAALTRAIIAQNPKNLLVIEVDKRCIPLLQELLPLYNKLDIIQANALEFDINTLVLQIGKVDIVSNLPYNIGTALLINWLKNINNINSITVMLQKEVANRICAVTSTKAYGRLSILSQILCTTQKCFDVAPQAFYPKPKVTSTVIRLVPHEIIPDTKVINMIEYITGFAFRERRKMIKSALKSLHENIEDILIMNNLDPKARAENFTPQDYRKLALALL